MLSTSYGRVPNGTFAASNTPLFLTTKFRQFALSLVRNHSLPALLGFVVSTSGINRAMQGYPFIYILQNNLPLSLKDIQALNAPVRHTKIWSTEVLYRSLLQAAAGRTNDKLALLNVAQLLSSKFEDLYRKRNGVCLHSAMSVNYLQKVLSTATSKNKLPPVQLSSELIFAQSKQLLDNLSCYFSQVGCKKYCKFLTFYGACGDALPSSSASDILRETLIPNGSISCSFTRMDEQENGVRTAVTSVLRDAINKIVLEREKMDILLHKEHSWYSIKKKFLQLFHETYTLPVIEHSLCVIKQLDERYKRSITFGDCSKFFQAIPNIEHAALRSTEYTSPTFQALQTIGETYSPLLHHDYVASINDDCSVTHIVTLSDIKTAKTPFLERVTYRATKRIQNFGRKIVAGIVPANDIEPLLSENTDSLSDQTSTAQHAHSFDIISTTQQAETSNDNEKRRSTARYCMTKTSWQQHLLRRFSKVRHVVPKKYRSLFSSKMATKSHKNLTLLDSKIITAARLLGSTSSLASPAGLYALRKTKSLYHLPADHRHKQQVGAAQSDDCGINEAHLHPATDSVAATDFGSDQFLCRSDGGHCSDISRTAENNNSTSSVSPPTAKKTKSSKKSVLKRIFLPHKRKNKAKLTFDGDTLKSSASNDLLPCGSNRSKHSTPSHKKKSSLKRIFSLHKKKKNKEKRALEDQLLHGTDDLSHHRQEEPEFLTKPHKKSALKRIFSLHKNKKKRQAKRDYEKLLSSASNDLGPCASDPTEPVAVHYRKKSVMKRVFSLHKKDCKTANEALLPPASNDLLPCATPKPKSWKKSVLKRIFSPTKKRGAALS